MAQIIQPERAQRSAGPGLSYWLGSKFFQQPLLMEQSAATSLLAAIREKAFDPAMSVQPLASKYAGTRAGQNGYRVTDDGIAIVPVSGFLVDRGEWLGDLNGFMTSYEGLAEQCRRLGKDESIKAVLLDVDSGGGMAAGMLDAAAAVATLRSKKRVFALAANFAASAAYGLACTADELFLTRTGGVGSIGTIITHTSYQRMLDEMGVDVTLIQSGRHKTDGNPYQQLSHGARVEFAAMGEQINDQFVGHVARERDITDDAVRALEARMFWGDKALGAKLADGVKTFDEVLEHIRAAAAKGGRPRGQSNKSSTASASRPDPNTGESGMTGQNDSGSAPDLTTIKIGRAHV